MGCIALVRCVLVLRCGLGGVAWCRYGGWSTSAQPAYGNHTTPANQNNTTHEITHQISRKLLRMDVLTSETCWAVNNEIRKQVTSSLSLFIQLWNLIFEYFSKICFYGWLKSDKNNGTLHEDQYTYTSDHISLNSSQNEKCFRKKVVEKIKTILYPIIFFPENRAVYEIIWKNVIEPDRPQVKI